MSESKYPRKTAEELSRLLNTVSKRAGAAAPITQKPTADATSVTVVVVDAPSAPANN